MNKYFFALVASVFITACSSSPNNLKDNDHSTDNEKGFIVGGYGKVISTSDVNDNNSGCDPSPAGSKGMFSSGEGTGNRTAHPCKPKPISRKTNDQAQASTNPKPRITNRPKPTVKPLLSYWVERIGQNAKPRVSTSTVFHSGDAIRLHVNSKHSGYLYVVNEGSSGRRSIIYPSTSAASEYVESNHDYVIPSRGHIRFDNQSGQETVWLFLSQKPLPVNNSSQSIEQLKSQAFEKVTYNTCGSKDLVVESPDSLQSNCGADSKDLVIEDDALAQENTTTVGLPNELMDQGKILAIKLKLRHD